MLYATTRSKMDSYTAYRTLHEDLAPDAGAFIPFKMPRFTREDIEAMGKESFGQVVAQILNVFFSAGLTGWDVDCCIGKNAAQLKVMSHRVVVANLWNNPDGSFTYAVQALYEKLCAGKAEAKPTQWAQIAIYIAFYFALITPLWAQGKQAIDVSVNSGDFTVPISAWYARQMGLPIGTIVCCCNENSAPWDFLHRGEINTGVSVVRTSTDKLDVAVPAGLERLVYGTFGYDETCKYLQVADKGGIYQIRPDMLQTIGSGIFVSVVGKDRIESVISSVYRSNNFILDPYCAVSYGGLQDYRAKTGESCPTLLFAEHSPLLFANCVQSATGLTVHKIKEHLDTL